MSTVTAAPPPRRIFEVGIAERALRSGLACRILDHGSRVAMAVETLPVEQARLLLAAGFGRVRLVLAGWRLASLGFKVAGEEVFAVALERIGNLGHLRALADPVRRLEELPFDGSHIEPASRSEAAALELCKLAGLLPAVLVTDEETARPLPVVAETDVVSVFAYRDWVARSLEPVVEAEVPLALAGKARFVAFRPADGGIEQYAVVIGSPTPGEPPLCRLHSECFTGDLFHSLRCDCGEQLEGAVRRMDEEGGGVLLYLRQEGRGIGLVNKLRAYRLQGEGMDTFEANMHLGFEPDERDFLAAATMLQRLGIGAVRLLTNNPAKVEALARHGIRVAERVPHSFAANRHNRFYLETKARKHGHLIDLGALREGGSDRRGVA
jgi:GTP cyclohydrolase II